MITASQLLANSPPPPSASCKGTRDIQPRQKHERSDHHEQSYHLQVLRQNFRLLCPEKRKRGLIQSCYLTLIALTAFSFHLFWEPLSLPSLSGAITPTYVPSDPLIRQLLHTVELFLHLCGQLFRIQSSLATRKILIIQLLYYSQLSTSAMLVFGIWLSTAHDEKAITLKKKVTGNALAFTWMSTLHLILAIPWLGFVWHFRFQLFFCIFFGASAFGWYRLRLQSTRRFSFIGVQSVTYSVFNPPSRDRLCPLTENQNTSCNYIFAFNISWLRSQQAAARKEMLSMKGAMSGGSHTTNGLLFLCR